MRHQHVGVDVVKMIVSSCSYLALALAAWVLFRLVQACFYLPGILQRRNEEEARNWLREHLGLPAAAQREPEATDEGAGPSGARTKDAGGDADDLPPPAEEDEDADEDNAGEQANTDDATPESKKDI